MPSIGITNLKEELSILLLTPQKHPAIHGVGIGEANGRECVRIYITDFRDPAVIPVLEKALGIAKLSQKPVFELVKNNKVFFVELVLARQSKMSASPAEPLDRASSAARLPSQVTAAPSCTATSSFTQTPAGVSIWCGNTGSPIGTISYFFKSTDGRTWMFSCNHVLANWAGPNTTFVASPVSRHSSGLLGYLAAFVPLDPIVGASSPPNFVDAAIASFTGGIQTKIQEAVSINSTVLPAIKMPVEKHGLSSCKTFGEIDDLSCNMIVGSTTGSKNRYFFKDQIRVILNKTLSPTAANFGIPGDSGSLVYKPVGSGKGDAVGVLFAIGDKGSLLTGLDGSANSSIPYAILNPIAAVTTKLQEWLRKRPGNGGLTLQLAGTTVVTPPKGGGAGVR